ncbi:MAG: ABC transporter permease, partial [Bacteroidales bacterium]|nr:ABC transporter permease [Bacteroidales bacterium]
MGYIRTFWNDFRRLFRQEFKAVFKDSGVIVIFFLAGMGYPLLYNMIYANGNLEDVPVVVVDNADCAESRRFVREVDATREVEISGYCATMEEAEKLMQERRCHGIIYFPADFGERIALKQQSTVGIYCDMGSFFYYKNLMTAANLVMLSEMSQISPMVKPMSYEENNPYNRSNAFNFFFITAALMLVIQQTMFYGMGMLAGTRREEKRGLIQGASGRVVFGRGAVYWLVYMMIGMYIVYLIPVLFDIPMVSDFWTTLIFLCIYVTACVFFSMACSTFVRHRETPIVALLFLTLPELFLTGFSWPQA